MITGASASLSERRMARRSRLRHWTRQPPLALDLSAITEQLQLDGITAFASSFAQLTDTVGLKRRGLIT